jgi:hypothetical protein
LNYNIFPIYFLLTGRFDFNKPYYQCENCGKDTRYSLSTIVEAGYWPGSPNDSSYLFHQDLFFLWDSLQKRMPGTSEAAFVRGLEDISSLKGRVCINIPYGHNLHLIMKDLQPNILFYIGQHHYQK